MNRPQYILLPVNPSFIAFSLAAAFLLDILPWGDWPGVPDFVALVLLFWNTHQPRKVGMGIAFMLGILLDIHNASLLGERALAYTLLSYGAIMIHRRVLWSPLPVQALQVMPLLVLAQWVPFIIRLLAGAPFPGWGYLIAGFVEGALWPLISLLLLAPQRRSADPDDTRPILLNDRIHGYRTPSAAVPLARRRCGIVRLCLFWPARRAFCLSPSMAA